MDEKRFVNLAGIFKTVPVLFKMYNKLLTSARGCMTSTEDKSNNYLINQGGKWFPLPTKL